MSPTETDRVAWSVRLATVPNIDEETWNQLLASVVQFEEPVGFKWKTAGAEASPNPEPEA